MARRKRQFIPGDPKAVRARDGLSFTPEGSEKPLGPPAAPNREDGDFERPERNRLQEIHGNPGDEEILGRVAKPLHRARQEGGRRAAVLGVFVPWPDRQRRGHEALVRDLVVGAR